MIGNLDMTLHEMTKMMNEENPNFGDNYAGYFDISHSEAARIAARAATVEEFVEIWENDDDWCDDE